jgi:hypothetical protein
MRHPPFLRAPDAIPRSPAAARASWPGRIGTWRSFPTPMPGSRPPRRGGCAAHGLSLAEYDALPDARPAPGRCRMNVPRSASSPRSADPQPSTGSRRPAASGGGLLADARPGGGPLTDRLERLRRPRRPTSALLAYRAARHGDELRPSGQPGAWRSPRVRTPDPEGCQPPEGRAGRGRRTAPTRTRASRTRPGRRASIRRAPRPALLRHYGRGSRPSSSTTRSTGRARPRSTPGSRRPADFRSP